MDFKMKKDLELIAEEYANVKFEGLNKLGEKKYSSDDFHNLETCRPKITAFKAGWTARDEQLLKLHGEGAMADVIRLQQENQQLKMLLGEFLIWSRENADDHNYYYGELVEKTRSVLKDKK